MADNVLKAAIEAIAESDNEIGGMLMTRLKSAHISGRDDSSVAGASDIITSPVDVFAASMIGLEIDVLLNPGGSTGNEDRYLIAATPTAKTAQVTTLLGGAVSFTAENPLRWRIGSLRVESTYDFFNPPTTIEPVGKLWVGAEPKIVTYEALTVAPGACVFRKLGDPLTGEGYLTKTHRQDTEVIDALKNYSAMDQLRRSFFARTAEEDDLDRLGRVNNVARLRGISDAIYRNLLYVMPYLPRGGTYAFELVLAALYPALTPSQIRALIYEDLQNWPCALFILLPELQPGTSVEGRMLFNEEELKTSSVATYVAVSRTPITIERVMLAPISGALDMDILPSAESPAWTYVTEGETEANTFAIVSGALQHTMVVSVSADGGRYKFQAPNIDKEACEISVWWSPSTLTNVANYPWHLLINDGEKELCLIWQDNRAALGKLDGTLVSSYVSLTLGTLGAWHHFRLRREGNFVYGFVDGIDLWGPVALTSFDATSAREVGLGYYNNGHTSNAWVVLWDNLSFKSSSRRNYFNLLRQDGALTLGSTSLLSAAALFESGDTHKDVRLVSEANNQNDGLWRATYVGTGEMSLSTIVRSEASVSGAGTSAIIELLDPFFRWRDIGKTITISNSTLGNNGDVIVLEVYSARRARVNKTGSFTPEQHVSWGFKPVFVTETNVSWELVKAGSNAGVNITLRDALPHALTPVKITYTSALGAQILRNEFITNQGSGGVVPNIYYPAYFLDADSAIQKLLDEDVKAAGIKLLYQRID